MKTLIMKKIVFIFMVVILFACSKEDTSNVNEELIGTWKLIEMSGNMTNSTTTGSDMDWQETYLLNSNGTFQKSREENGDITEASGTYSLNNSSNETILELIFNDESDIIGSCDSELKEDIVFQSENTLSSTWKYCDGPGLTYKRVSL